MIVGSDTPELCSELVEAVHHDRLSSWPNSTAGSTRSASADDGTRAPATTEATADGPQRAAAAAAVSATCARIRSANIDECDRLVAAFGDLHVVATSASDQRRTLTIDVLPADAPDAAAAIRDAGFQTSCTWARGAFVSWWRRGDSQTFTRDGTATAVVQLRWRQRRRGRLQQLVGPTPADWDAIELPTRLWWAYSIVRPVRLVAERLRLRSADHSALEPFLVTPESLIEPLLDVASVGPDDVVFDFGCGDGRSVVAAAALRGCRALGVEQSPALCAAAIERAAAAGVGDRVRIVNADAASVDLAEVTVVVLFLPMVVAARVVPDLLARLAPGARVVLHEQSPLAATLPQTHSVSVIVTDDAVTVAHRWNVGA